MHGQSAGNAHGGSADEDGRVPECLVRVHRRAGIATGLERVVHGCVGSANPGSSAGKVDVAAEKISTRRGLLETHSFGSAEINSLHKEELIRAL